MPLELLRERTGLFQLVPSSDRAAIVRPRCRRRRFDWLYDQMAATGKLESILSDSLDVPDKLWLRLRTESNHELRAALICLLTAAFAAQSAAAVVGEPIGGWFWLPPRALWQPWATKGIESVTKRMGLKSQSLG